MPLLPVIALTALCNLMLLSAMAAGRSNGGWRRGLLLGAEISLLMVALIVAILIALGTGTHDKYAGALLAILGLVFAVAVAGLLTYLEYRLVGQHQSFARDVRRSMWVGRLGVERLDDPDD